MAKFASSGPTPEIQPSLTDTYFKHTRNVVRANGDCEVTYAVFMRRPVTFAGSLADEWITAMAKARGAKLKIEQLYVEGAWIGAGEPMCYITGPLSSTSGSGNNFSATPWSSVRCSLQCLQYVYRITKSSFSRNGRAPLCGK